ncbi:hypothetical protein VE03_10368 [Pseudogymnoascus sp. 23342-1-I1]|nr:hypothetical protein VE03_10368 [Pseudogymnoascus sp. 23342-1-I1]
MLGNKATEFIKFGKSLSEVVPVVAHAPCSAPVGLGRNARFGMTHCADVVVRFNIDNKLYVGVIKPQDDIGVSKMLGGKCGPKYDVAQDGSIHVTVDTVKSTAAKEFMEESGANKANKEVILYEAQRDLLNHVVPNWRDELNNLGCAISSTTDTETTLAMETTEVGITALLRPTTLNVPVPDKTKLIVAAFIGEIDVVHKLLEDGTCPDSEDEEQQPVLCWAVLQDNFDVMVALLDAGAMVDKTGKDGMTAIHHAARNGQQTNFVRRLLEADALRNKPDSYGRVAFHYAAEGGDVETFELLAKQTGPNAAPKAGLLRDKSGASPLEIAASGGHTGIIWLILRKNMKLSIDQSNVLVLSAMRNGYTHIIDMFLAAGMSPAVLSDPETFWRSARNGRQDMVRLQLKHGADPNAGEYEEAEELGEEPMTPLDIAVLRGHHATAIILESAGGQHSSQFLNKAKEWVDLPSETRNMLSMFPLPQHRTAYYQLANYILKTEAHIASRR